MRITSFSSNASVPDLSTKAADQAASNPLILAEFHQFLATFYIQSTFWTYCNKIIQSHQLSALQCVGWSVNDGG